MSDEYVRIGDQTFMCGYVMCRACEHVFRFMLTPMQLLTWQPLCWECSSDEQGYDTLLEVMQLEWPGV